MVVVTPNDPSECSSDGSDTPMLPSSLMLLNTAHEYLGRRSLCCNSDGALLKFYVSLSQLAYLPFLNSNIVLVMHFCICVGVTNCIYVQYYMSLTKLYSSVYYRFKFWKKRSRPLPSMTLIPTKRSWRWPWNSAFSASMATPVRRARPATLRTTRLHRSLTLVMPLN